MNIPKITIIGRPNVGKSTLFNRLAGQRISIVDNQPGITRDRISIITDLEGIGLVELIDTGGFGIEEGDLLSKDVERQIGYALKEADLILFVVDLKSTITKIDTKLAEELRKYNTPVIVVANKADSPKLELQAAEFYKLGFDKVVPISALHGTGIRSLIDTIKEKVPTTKGGNETKDLMKLAIVGARNAGKSTFINALTGSERVIVSPLPGTTRDAIDVMVKMGKKTFIAIDTAGMIKSSQIKDSVDFYSMVRLKEAIKRSDVVILMIDATSPVGKVTKKLAGIISENYKPALIAINKWDLTEGKVSIEQYREYLDKVLPTLNYAPICAVSALRKENIKETIKVAEDLYKQSKIRIPTSKLNKVLEQIKKIKPPSARSKKRPKFYYATQIDISPPTIVLFVNDPELFSDNYKRFLVNKMRELLAFKEIPIKIMLRKSAEEKD